MKADDEITMKEAAQYVKRPDRFHLQTLRELAADVDADPELAAEYARLKREHETGEASAQLDAMLAASRAGKRVVK